MPDLELKPARPAREIRHIPPESPLIDALGGAARHELKVLDHGFIALIDLMPRLVPQGQTADAAIVQAARVSYGHGTKRVNEDRGLIRYLLRHRHTTPFEMVELKFHVAMPIFVARQWIRHRTANVNEYSGRYSLLPDTFYRPTIDAVRKQSKANRQGGEEVFRVAQAPTGSTSPGLEDSATPSGSPEGDRDALAAEDFLKYLDEAEALYQRYVAQTERGVSRELARIGLPVSLYTQWYWKCDLHNILRFLSLRMDPHAQLEIREYAEAMGALMEPLLPVTMEAWRDYEFGAVRLSRLEVEALRDFTRGGTGNIATDNGRERAEWDAKRAVLGLDFRSDA